jgi:Na+-transporting methylmalonyl-CoA/oxaloacetate decarboxylase gamma subunit
MTKHTIDVVYLKNGNQIKGFMFNVPNPTDPFVQIVTEDDSVKVINSQKIETLDVLKLNDGSQISGMATSVDEKTEIVTDDGKFKIINNADITSREKKLKVGLSDKVITKDNTYIQGIIDLDGNYEISIIPEVDTKQPFPPKTTVQTIKVSEIRTIHINAKDAKFDVIIKNDGTQIIGDIENLEEVNVITSGNNKKKIPITEVKQLNFIGTLKFKELDPLQEFEKIKAHMGAKNIVQTSPTGEVSNGYLFSAIGMLVVFIGLVIMVIVFTILNLFSRKSKATVDKKKDNKPIAIKVPEGLSPELVSAIAVTINLAEEESNVILTINREKSTCSNWAYSGRVENAQRAHF